MLMFLVSFIPSPSTEFSPCFMPTSSGFQKYDSNFIMIIIVCPTCVKKNFGIKFQKPKLIIHQNAHKFPNKKHTHSHIQKKSSHKLPTKKQSPIQKKKDSTTTTTTKSALGKTKKSVQSQWEILSSFIRPSHPQQMS